MRKILFVIVLVFLPLFNLIQTNDFNETKENVDDYIVNMSNFDNPDISLSDFLFGVVSCEMPALFNEEALKAGVVAARTYYLYNLFNNDNYIPTSMGQCYYNDSILKSRWKDKYVEYSNKIRNVVSNTRNEVILYDGEVIQAYYFSMSNGYTEDSINVFNHFKPYLVSVSSNFDKDIKNNVREVSFSTSEFLNLLGLSGNVVSINSTLRNESNRINRVCVNDKCYSGTEFRKILNLRSTDFEISVFPNQVVITTLGYGHGVGMSQYGANEMAKQGYSYKEILKYYYKDVEIAYK